MQSLRYTCALFAGLTLGIGNAAESSTDLLNGALRASSQMAVFDDGYQDPTCQEERCCTQESQVLGDDGANALEGTKESECLVGFDGADTINGKAGDDELIGGPANDVLDGGRNDDFVTGGTGDDTLYGGPDDDILLGGVGKDEIHGGRGNDVLYPGVGADTTFGDAGDDVVIIHDSCEVESGEVIDGGTGDDTLVISVTLDKLRASIPDLTVDGFETVVVDPSARCRAECTLPCTVVDPEYIGLPDPDMWMKDEGSGARYRRTTANEQRINGWLPGSWLVENATFVANAVLGAPKVVVGLPNDDGILTEIKFTKTSETSQRLKVQREIESASAPVLTAVTTPMLFTYLQSGFEADDPRFVDDAWMDLISTDDGEISATGVFNDHIIDVNGRNPGWTLDAVSVPDGQPPIDQAAVVQVEFRWIGSYNELVGSFCRSGLALCDWFCLNTGVPCGNNQFIPLPPHCADGKDNDGDLTADSGDTHCQHSEVFSCDEHPNHVHSWESGESFALFGDGRFCTAYRENWFAKTSKWASAAFKLVNGAAPKFGSPGERVLRYIAGGCWIFPSVEEAYDCTQNGNCPAFAAEYPYAGAGDVASNYYGGVFNDAAHGAKYGLNEALSLAVVIYWGTPDGGDGPVNPLDCIAEEGSGCCGASNADQACNYAGAGVAEWERGGECTAGTTDITIAHEIGHALGLSHDSSRGPVVGSAAEGNSFMEGDESNRSVALNDTNQWRLECALQENQCGREGGFEYSGTTGECGGCALVCAMDDP